MGPIRTYVLHWNWNRVVPFHFLTFSKMGRLIVFATNRYELDSILILGGLSLCNKKGNLMRCLTNWARQTLWKQNFKSFGNYLQLTYRNGFPDGFLRNYMNATSRQKYTEVPKKSSTYTRDIRRGQLLKYWHRISDAECKSSYRAQLRLTFNTVALTSKTQR